MGLSGAIIKGTLVPMVTRSIQSTHDMLMLCKSILKGGFNRPGGSHEKITHTFGRGAPQAAITNNWKTLWYFVNDR